MKEIIRKLSNVADSSYVLGLTLSIQGRGDGGFIPVKVQPATDLLPDPLGQMDEVPCHPGGHANPPLLFGQSSGL